MMRKLPMISPCAGPMDILKALCRAPGRRSPELFAEALAPSMRPRRIFLTNSGISSFYVILKSLSRLSPRTEVLLPAYTAGSLIVAVHKAGLKPVLYDISLKDFNGDIDSLMLAISDKTLAAVCVHMFGVGTSGIAGLREKLPPDIFLLEDCAQAMGSTIGGVAVGDFGDVAFYSFNRGKNLPLFGGGFISTNNDRIAAAIKEESMQLAGEGLFTKLSEPLKLLAFFIASHPAIYGPAFSIISRFKETAPPKDFDISRMSDFQASLGLSLLKKRDDIFLKRYNNGMALIEGLKNVSGIILPEMDAKGHSVFNRMPILFKEPARRDLAAKRLWDIGIETSTMYIKPLHHMFDLGYARDEFPNAVHCAQRLLALPTHPMVDDDAIKSIIRVIKETMS